jgi:mono/diheme cytochrome c family protein
MRKRLLGSLLALFIAVEFLARGAAAAELYGPMSSGKKPEEPTVAAPEKQPAADANPSLDVKKLFAGTCGFCHSSGGRVAGKGPKLMGTTLTDSEIVQRIRLGKTGTMPAFGSTFTDVELHAIVKYIRELREETPGQ